MTQQIAWGILGCARIARRALIRGIQGSRLGRLAAIASRDGEKARRWAEEFGVPRHYASYEALLADPDIRAVYVPLPNELHKLWTRAAAAAGKHVLCDKPLGLNADEADEMVDACRRAGVVLMEGFMWRHHPRTSRLLEIVRGGAIGELRLIRSSFSFDIDRNDWRLDAARGGGALWDVGCYGVNASRLLCAAEPTSISARARWQCGVDVTLAATMEFPGGVLSQIDCSFENPYRCSLEVVGTRGAIELPNAYLPGDAPEIHLRAGTAMERISVAAADQYAEMVDHFARSVITGQPLAPPAESGLANMRVLDAIARAARDALKL